MLRGLSDTTANVERVQIELLRRAGMERRLQIAAEMSVFAIDAALSALRSLHPQLSEQEISLLFVELNYGSVFAAGVRKALAARDMGR